MIVNGKKTLTIKNRKIKISIIVNSQFSIVNLKISDFSLSLQRISNVYKF